MITIFDISQFKGEIHELLNRVSETDERTILTYKGQPKAVLISFEDYTRLQQTEQIKIDWTNWLAETQALAERIRQGRGNQDIDVDAILNAVRSDRGEPDD